MCCRYWFDESPELRPFVEEMNRSPLVEKFVKTGPITTQGEVRPTNVVPVIASNKRGQKAVYPMKWGFSGRTLLVNARSETASTKPTFSDAWKSHRCIVPASYYFEWEHLISNDGKKKTGPKYLIQPKDSAVTWMCGLYRIEEGLPVFVILTRAPGEEIRFIHDRMPLILPEQYVGEWIKPETRPEELVKEAQTEMYFEKA
jgi:putative SOS response-associated peptidase YedK